MQSLGSMAVRLRQTPWLGCWNSFASERTLGLPRERRPDKDLSFSEALRRQQAERAGRR